MHVLENLLAANTAHGEKLVGLILSFPGSQRSRDSPDSPEPAVLTTGPMGVCAPCAPAAGNGMEHPCPAPASTLHSVSVSQSPSCSHLSWVWVETQQFKIFFSCHTYGHLCCCCSPFLWASIVKAVALGLGQTHTTTPCSYRTETSLCPSNSQVLTSELLKGHISIQWTELTKIANLSLCLPQQFPIVKFLFLSPAMVCNLALC